MIYPVKVLTPDGTLKKEIDSAELQRAYWKQIDIDIGVVKQLKNPANMQETPEGPRVRKKPVATICAVWPRICARDSCNIPHVHRSFSGRYCSMNCRRLAANEKKRAKSSS